MLILSPYNLENSVENCNNDEILIQSRLKPMARRIVTLAIFPWVEASIHHDLVHP